MSVPKKERVPAGSQKHLQALRDLDSAAKGSGRGSGPYNEAVEALKKLQGRMDWPISSGIIGSEGDGRLLSVQFLKDRFVRVERNTGREFPWNELKQELVSQELPRKEAARFFQLIKFRTNGHEKFGFTFDKPREQYSSHGISRCQENIEWVDGLTLDFDSGITVEEFVEAYQEYEFLLTSSFNHAPENDKHKFRVVMPLRQRVGAAEIKARRKRLQEKFAGVDPASFSLSQGFYVPSHPPGRTPVRVENGGGWFDLMAVPLDPSKPRARTSMVVKGEGKGEEIVAALMNCMPPDTEYFRELPGTEGHTYNPVILPFLFSLGYWGRENGLSEAAVTDLVMQRWGDSEYAGQFQRIVEDSDYGDLGLCLSFVRRVGNALKEEIDLGISQDEFRAAREVLDRLIKGDVEVREIETVSPEQAEGELRNELIQRVCDYRESVGEHRTLVVRYEAGAGKTKTLIFILNLVLRAGARPDGRTHWTVDYLVPDGKLGDEIAVRIKKELEEGIIPELDTNKVHVQVIQGRKKLCIDPKVIKADELGYSVASPCEDCQFFDRCEYTRQYIAPEGKHLVRIIYQGMLGNKAAGFDEVNYTDFFVIDEDAIMRLYNERVFGHVYNFVREMPAGLGAKSSSRDISRAIKSGVISEISELSREREQRERLPAVRFADFRNGRIDEETFSASVRERKSAEASRGETRSLGDLKRLRRCLYQLSNNQLFIREDRSGVRQLVMPYMKPLAGRYAHRPCVYMDATVEELVARRVFIDRDGLGRPVDFWERNITYSDAVTVHQDTSRSWSMNSLCPREGGERVVNETLLLVAWDEMVRRSLMKGRKFALITYKDVAEFVRAGRVPKGCKPIKGEPLFCGVGHFGNIRGQDVFNQGGVEDLYVVGRHMVGDDVVEHTAMAVFAEDVNPLSFETEQVSVEVGPGVVLDHTRYVDERVQAVNRMLNAAETAQAAHRLRLIHGKTEKNLYLLTNAVIPVRVNKGMEVIGEGRITKADQGAAEVREALIRGECAIKSGTRWRVWPQCVDQMDSRMRKSILDRVSEEPEVFGCSGGFFPVRTKDRKKKDVFVVGLDEQVCKERAEREFTKGCRA